MPDIELSEREREILRLAATGASNKEIARQLFISPNTVKVHLRNIFEKIGAASRTEAALFAMQNGLVEAPAAPGAEAGEPPVPALPAVPPRRARWSLAAGGVVLLALLALAAWAGGRLGTAASTPSAANPTPLAQPTPTPPLWQQGPALPAGRNAMASAVFENSLFLLGGESAAGVSAEVLQYDFSAQTWKMRNPLPQPAADIHAAVLGGKIFVPGGRLADGSLSSRLDAYDPAADRWEARAPLPVALSAYALCAFEGRLYLFGGWDGQAPRDEVLTYDPLDDRWSRAGRMPAALAHAAAAAAQNHIYLVGGEGHSGPSARAWTFSPQAAGDAMWKEIAALPAARSRMGITGLANMLYVAGGLEDGRPAESALAFQPQNNRWVAYSRPAQPPGSAPALEAYEAHLHLLGGRDAGGVLSNHQVYQAFYTVLIPIVQ